MQGGHFPQRTAWLKKRYLIGGLILLAAVAYLLYLSFGNSVSYYVTVSEFYDRGEELYDTSVRVAGIVADSPVDWDAEALELKFTIAEGGASMAVMYHGAAPSGFAAGNDILVEGKYSADGIFRATQIILKCPSKYELEE
jgi:cytochrome c-type biogenesis protein CcmE